MNRLDPLHPLRDGFRTAVCLMLLSVGLAPLPGRGEEAEGTNWTRFRGPNGSGVSETELPATWTPDSVNWKTKLPGLGHSSPAIYGKRVFLLSADPDTATRYVVCLDAESGRTEWIKEFASEPHHLHLRSSYASCSPAVDAERVYVAWSTPARTTLMALSHGGDVKWDLDLGPWVSQHGYGTSPVLYEDLVIVSNSQQASQLKPGQTPGKSFVLAFERATGKERWRTPMTSTNVSYSVPCIYQPASGPAELICCNSKQGMVSLNPRTGQQNWAIEAFDKRTVSSPVVAGDLIFGSTGSGGGGNYVAAIKPGANPTIAYKIDRQAPYVPTLVTRGELAFLWSDKGIVSCIEIASGNVVWQKRLDAAFSGSPIRAGDKLYGISEDGVVYVLAAGREFQLLGTNPLGEESRSTPAVAGGRIYLRTYSHLVAVGAKSL